MFFVSPTLSAQQLTYKFIDSITYVQLINHKNEELIRTAESALNEEIDFYYLRMRLGIAYYELTNYEHALPHFTKANKMNPADTICQEYLYYSYLFSGRTEDAYIFAFNHPELQKRIGYKKNNIESVTIAAGYGLTNNLEEGKVKEISGAKFNYGQALYQGPFFYSSILLEQRIKNRLKVLYGGWYYNTNSMGAVQVRKKLTTQEYMHSHYQYNLALSYYTKNKFAISIAGAGYVQNSAFLYAIENKSTLKYDFYTLTNQLYSYAFVAGVGKRIGKIYPTINLATSNFIESKQYQAEASVLFYPFNNTNFYLTTAASYQSDNGENKWVFFQKLGGKVSKKIWVEENFSTGNHFNYVSKYASLTYNTLEPIKIITGLDLKYYFSKMILTTGYRFQQLEGSSYYYENSSNAITQKYTYINNLFSTSLQWNF